MFWISLYAFLGVCGVSYGANYTISVSPLRWGFLGCGRITNNFAAAVQSLPRNEHLVQAFASRNASRAEDYRKSFGGVKAYGSYAELAKDPNIDVVYIGVIHPVHYEVAKMLLNNNKHVLCEKPLTLMKSHAEELISLAQQKKLFFQEAVWPRFFPAYYRLRDQLPLVGDVEVVTANFGDDRGNRDQRLYRKELGGGTMKDLGSYTVQFALEAFNGEMPEKIFAVAKLNNESVDMTTSMTLQWKNGGSAALFVSKWAHTTGDATIFGSKASLHLDHVQHPKEIELCRKSKDSENKTVEKYEFPKVDHRLTFSPGGEGMVYEAQEVRRCMQNGWLESPYFTQKDSLTVLAIADEVLKQIGVEYDSLYKDGKYIGSELHPEYDGT